MIFAVFDPWLLTQWINCSFYHLHLLFIISYSICYSSRLGSALCISTFYCAETVLVFFKYDFLFSRWPLVTFLKCKILSAEGVWRAETRDHAKFCRN